jgi:ABC-type nitrate/sulfonate/bicarbonate transport system substrate-binding protein
MDPTKLPYWLRIALVVGIVVLVAGASLFGWRWYARPTTLTIAVGSLDGEASRLVSGLAGKLAQQKAPVRLTMVEAGSALDAASMFAAGKVDLAVVRGDVGDLSQAQAVAVVAHSVALLVAPPGSAITDFASLKRTTVGVLGGEINRRLVKVLTDEYDLTKAGVTFKSLTLPDARRALEAKEVRAVLVMMPLAEKYLSLLRGLFPQSAKSGPVLIAIEQAGAIAEKGPCLRKL